MRGAPGATDGTAQVYLGVFSPTRGTYQVQRPGRRAAVVADQRRLLRRRQHGRRRSTSCRATRRRSATSPSGSGRCARSAPRPPVERPAGPGRPPRSRTVTSRARSRTPRTVTLEKPAVVLGGTVAVLADLGARRDRDGRHRRSRRASSASRCRTRSSGRSSSATRASSATDVDRPVRPPHDHQPADLRPELRLHRPAADGRRGHPRLGLGRACSPVEIAGQTPRATGNVLYYLPTDLAVQGKTTFRSDLLALDGHRHRRAVLQQGPVQHQLRARQRRRVAYRPIAFDGTLDADRARLRPQLRRRPGRRSRSTRSRSSRSPRSRRPCPDPPTDDCVAAGLRRPARGRAVRPRRRATGCACRT